MEHARLIRKIAAAARAAAQLLQHAEQSLPTALFVVAGVTMAAVACTAGAKLREPPPATGRWPDREWWVLGAASGVAVSSIWVSLVMATRRADHHHHLPRRAVVVGRVFLGVAVAAFLATVAVSELDLELLLELMEAMLQLHRLPNQPAA